MRCKTCDYSLWGIAGRSCPECGAGFLPSGFDLVPNAVRFLCPHCRQQYFGTGPQGHLDPIEFDCVSCGAAIHMDQMVLEPREGIADDRTRADRNPWLERPRIKLRAAYWRTVGKSIGSPMRLARATPRESSASAAIGFFAINLIWVLALNALPLLAIMLLPSLFLGGGGGGGSTWFQVILPIAMLIGVPTVGMFLVFFLWALITQVVLSLIATRAWRMGDTIKAMAYSSAPVLLMAIPCVGVYALPIGMIWWAIGGIAMLTAIHRIAWWRAAIAHTIGMVIALGLPAGGAAYAIYGIVNNTQAAMAGAMSSIAAHNLYADLNATPGSTTGPAPIHLIDLITAQSGLPYSADNLGDFRITPPEMLIDGKSLMNHLRLPQAELDARNADLRAAMLPSGIHRIGHLVLTYHGIDLANPPTPDLWIAIVWPDPDSGAVFTRSQSAAVIDAYGSATDIDVNRFSVEIQIQNAMRKSLNIPEIPDPATVHMWPPGSAYGPSPAPAPAPVP